MGNFNNKDIMAFILLIVVMIVSGVMMLSDIEVPEHFITVIVTALSFLFGVNVNTNKQKG